jgi:hypothetical protein
MTRLGTAGVEDLWEMEEAFWLQGREYYLANLAPGAVMYFPGQTDLLDREAIIKSIDDRDRWSHLMMEDCHRIDPRPDIAILTYLAQAKRSESAAEYRAHCVSCYQMRGDNWLLSYHQQIAIAP